jgi:hypothetical protein
LVKEVLPPVREQDTIVADQDIVNENHAKHCMNCIGEHQEPNLHGVGFRVVRITSGIATHKSLESSRIAKVERQCYQVFWKE